MSADIFLAIGLIANCVVLTGLCIAVGSLETRSLKIHRLLRELNKDK